ncbi:uncharacterized protein [Penaeus vannamei]|uniref:uncharacterized protein isoform X1 n=1 Tax=Penaeus vannamei TaxID=6689 RepID=UPI00387F6AC8
MLNFTALVVVLITLSQAVNLSLSLDAEANAPAPADGVRQQAQRSARPRGLQVEGRAPPLSAPPDIPRMIVVSGKPIGHRDAAPGASAGHVRRGKRKVISRGGYYIIRSSSGSSPWSSTSYDSGAGYHNSRYQGYGYNTRGPIGDGGTRTYSFPSDDGQKRRHNRRATRKRLNKSFKREIARYAIMYGAEQTAKHYEPSIGRRLKNHVIAKFVERHRDSFQNLKKRKKKNRKTKETKEDNN